MWRIYGVMYVCMLFMMCIFCVCCSRGLINDNNDIIIIIIRQHSKDINLRQTKLYNMSLDRQFSIQY